MYYYFCIDIKDYVFQKIDNKGIVTVAVLPKYLCIKTYIPLGSFYEKLLLDISGSSDWPEYVNSQRVLELKREKPLSEKSLQNITNMKFEFEDYRIENKGTQPSRWLLDLNETPLENRLPKQLTLGSSQTTLTYNVPVFD